MKSVVLYIVLAVLFVDFINAKPLKTKIFRERRYAPRPPPLRHGGPPPQRFPLQFGSPVAGQMPVQGGTPLPGQMPGQMRPPMPGLPGPMGQQQMGAPGCGGCAQGPKMCPAICMRWNTIIKPNGQVENGPSSITPLAPNERVGPNGVFPPMTQMMGPMQQPGMMQQPYMPQPMFGAGFPSPGAPPTGGAQPLQGPPPAAGGATAAPQPTQG